MKRRIVLAAIGLIVFALAGPGAAAGSSGKPTLHLLLIGNTQNEGQAPLEHALSAINAWRGDIDTVVFVPFATKNYEYTTEKARASLAKIGVKVVELTPDRAGKRTLAKARAVYVGGGNTFRLLHTLQQAGLLEPLRRRILAGMPYMGSSAGSDIASPTIMTTNDMPIDSVASFKSLDIVPFQINPHYFDPIKGMPAETRDDRLFEFLQDNTTPILALRQGAWVTVDGDVVTLEGAGARVFRAGDKPNDEHREFAPGAKLSLQLAPL